MCNVGDKLCLNKEETEIIKELLSEKSCGHERATYYFHCCDANDIIRKIDEFLETME